MKLHYHPISSYSHKVLIALAEKGLSFEPHVVQLRDPAARAEYRKISPHGKVPVLELQDGWRIPESSIIIEYLDTHSDAGTRLIPADRDGARRARFFDRIGDLYVMEPSLTVLFDGMKPPGEREPARVAKAKETLGVSLGLMDQHFAKGGPWVLGDAFTMADCAWAPALELLRAVHPFDERKHVAAYFQRLVERPSVKAVIEEGRAAREAFFAAPK